ncbi:hypothetical protein CJF42_25625 [Pseudoalteromonas sp. NBT06-2]|uniref:DUF2268 domain-containing putative Zn-dependent protease n=1 Tax=Pseudoalteromonas sp. NBT06-2 TaxID=2025950 RepID=UPI000BA7995A|nr:DUF2268 domain-containing putative Zn-dependent protease [Pseudoalteromonas sp. NBT06-2]PAJ71643.1 hypothetical protein CJF42_25625 [Pseudoalteromonas sp. NBT06-2]
MKNKTFSLLFATFTYISIGKFSPVLANDFILDDAERFAKLFTQTSELDEKQIKNKYLNLGTKGLEIFTPNRIKNEKNLIRAISENSDAYKKGIDVCLPAARNIASDAKQVLNDVKTLLQQEMSAPTYILFGADNSGGTASKEGLSLGLEVVCRFSETEEEAKEIILGFVAHEIVHVYQARLPENKTKKYTLLRQALSEGFADFIANRVLGKINQSEIERHSFGVKNESVIWTEFKSVMNGENFTPWMYGSGGDGRPKDLGYWLGKRIAQSYYEKADDKKKALVELLYLKDPQSILLSSGYNPT